MDKAPVGLTEQILKKVVKVDGVVEVERIRARPSGHTFFVDVIVKVSRKASVELVHKTTKEIESQIQKMLPDADVVVHIKPVAIDGETAIERVQTIAHNHNVSVHDISVYNYKNKKYINFDLEVDNSLSLDKAHKVSSDLEAAIVNELGTGTVVNTHIEPFNSSASRAKTISQKETESVHKAVKEIKTQIAPLKDVHKILINRVEDKICISLHATFDQNISLEEAHNLSNTMQYMIKKSLPNVERVTVHSEPKE